MAIKMFKHAKNSKVQGDIGLSQAIAYFVKEGYTVSIPLTDSQDYDLVVDMGKLLRVQAKTTSHKSKENSFIAQLSVQGGNRSWNGIRKKFDKEKVDAVFIVTSDGDKYFIPSSEFDCKNTITVSKKYIKFLVQ